MDEMTIRKVRNGFLVEQDRVPDMMTKFSDLFVFENVESLIEFIRVAFNEQATATNEKRVRVNNVVAENPRRHARNQFNPFVDTVALHNNDRVEDEAMPSVRYAETLDNMNRTITPRPVDEFINQLRELAPRRALSRAQREADRLTAEREMSRHRAEAIMGVDLSNDQEPSGDNEVALSLTSHPELGNPPPPTPTPHPDLTIPYSDEI
jgi:hypothetical protein